LTGFFMFKREKTVKETAIYLLKRIIIPTVFLLLFIQVFADWLYGRASLLNCLQQINKDDIKAIGTMFLNWTMPQPNFWLWYITTLVKIYFFYPLLKYICVDKKEENMVRRGYIILCFLAMMFLPTIKRLVLNVPSIYVYSPLPFYAFVYVLLGYEFSLLYQKKSKFLSWQIGLWLYIIGALSTYWITFAIDIAKDGVFDHNFFNYEMVNVMIAAIGLFILFVKMPILLNDRINRVMNRVATMTFAIYLIHYPVILKLNTIKLNAKLVELFGILPGCLIFICIFFFLACFLVTVGQWVTKQCYHYLERFNHGSN